MNTATLVPITYSERPGSLSERRAYYAKNALALAKKLESLPDNRHNQSRWARRDSHCGTVGCALGIAAMSHIIPGLQYTETDNASFPFEPTINGKTTAWHEAAMHFFGENILHSVFLNLHASKQSVISMLRDAAKDLTAPRYLA